MADVVGRLLVHSERVVDDVCRDLAWPLGDEAHMSSGVEAAFALPTDGQM